MLHSCFRGTGFLGEAQAGGGSAGLRHFLHAVIRILARKREFAVTHKRFFMQRKVCPCGQGQWTDRHQGACRMRSEVMDFHPPSWFRLEVSALMPVCSAQEVVS